MKHLLFKAKSILLRAVLIVYVFTLRLKDIEKGYWEFVRYFTRMDAIKMINKLTQVTTDLGKGNTNGCVKSLCMSTMVQDVLG